MGAALSTPCVVAVIGAGAMGAGIAQVAAAAGHRVRLLDNQAGAAARAAGEPADAVDFAGLAEPLPCTTETGMTPSRSTCATAAARSPASRTPSTSSPERRRAL